MLKQTIVCDECAREAAYDRHDVLASALPDGWIMIQRRQGSYKLEVVVLCGVSCVRYWAQKAPEFQPDIPLPEVAPF